MDGEIISTDGPIKPMVVVVVVVSRPLLILVATNRHGVAVTLSSTAAMVGVAAMAARAVVKAVMVRVQLQKNPGTLVGRAGNGPTGWQLHVGKNGPKTNA